MIANAEICDAPVAGEQFTDVAAVAAVLAILDGLASKTLAALDTVDLPDAARAAAMAALEDAATTSSRPRSTCLCASDAAPVKGAAPLLGADLCQRTRWLR
jgi:hypothetical protein